MNEKTKVILTIIGMFIFFTLILYTTNLGTNQFTGYVVYTQYETFPLRKTHITLCYGHPDTVSHAQFVTFRVYGYYEFEYGKLYRITTHAKITQTLKHVTNIELLETPQ